METLWRALYVRVWSRALKKWRATNNKFRYSRKMVGGQLIAGWNESDEMFSLLCLERTSVRVTEWYIKREHNFALHAEIMDFFLSTSLRLQMAVCNVRQPINLFLDAEEEEGTIKTEFLTVKKLICTLIQCRAYCVTQHRPHIREYIGANQTEKELLYIRRIRLKFY